MNSGAQQTLGDLRQVATPANPSAPTTSAARDALHRRYADKLEVLPALTRSLVSFQANKTAPFYRWFKYREGFSTDLVSYFLDRYKPKHSRVPRVLDPFAGAGTTLTTSRKRGWEATGIELLPVGAAAIRARLASDTVNVKAFRQALERLKSFPLDESSANGYRFPHIRITAGAFPPETEQAISAFMAFLPTIKDKTVRELFHFACQSILEDVSYTRKDGQYLRWDNRSGRALKATFSKGEIYEFHRAITRQLELMLEDIARRPDDEAARQPRLIEGSSLAELPGLEANYFDLVITSPPYCNRYDYTRTYALELAFLKHDDEGVKRLRQTLLSATVENKSKSDWLAELYRARSQGDRYDEAIRVFEEQDALQEVLRLLYGARDRGELNNGNIPNLVEHYFFEMNFIIRELARTLAPGGYVVMVNDNVQYHGEEVPVDLILSDFAARAGLTIDHIWFLPRGKGNSSQQMGIHGRKELRKGVYIWSKPLAD